MPAFGLPDGIQACLFDLDGVLTRGASTHAESGSVDYLHALHDAGVLTAVVSPAPDCRQTVRAAKLDGLLDDRVDGLTARRRGLRPTPAPDTFLAAAEHLGVAPGAAAVFVDEVDGVTAARDGGFGFVVAVDRSGQADDLQRAGADRVVGDLSELLAGGRR